MVVETPEVLKARAHTIYGEAMESKRAAARHRRLTRRKFEELDKLRAKLASMGIELQIGKSKPGGTDYDNGQRT